MRRSDQEQGFTLVELMVAALVLVVGLLATVGVLINAERKTTLNKQRVAATNLARELTEAARVAQYTSLTSPDNIAAGVQAAGTNLGTGGSAAAWTVQRRNTTFTITTGVCTYDDPADFLDAQPPIGPPRCALPAGTPTTTGDNDGNDFRRVTFSVSWRAEGKTQTFTQSALIANPSGGLGPKIVPPFPASPLSPVIVNDPAQTSITFTVKTINAYALRWTIDDGVSAGTAGGGPTTWTFDWNLGAAGAAGSVLDGTYSLSGQALDSRGVAGDKKVATVQINRSAPLAPAYLRGGHDTRAGDWVDLEWALNNERDIIGYRVYYAGSDNLVGGGDDRLVCPSATASPDYVSSKTSTCQDTSPPSGAAKYYVKALDRDTSGDPREGAAAVLSIPAPTTQPQTPGSLQLNLGGPPTLTWSGSGSPAFYRVYRDGTAPSNRIGKLTGTTYVDNGGDDGQQHDYWVTAVDSSYNESALLGPVHWNG